MLVLCRRQQHDANAVQVPISAARIILGLNGAEPLHDIARPLKGRQSELLIKQSLVSNIQSCYSISLS